MPRIIWPSTKAAAGAFCISSFMPQGWRTMRIVEVAVALEDVLGVVGRGAGVEHRQRAAAEQRVEPALAGIEELLDLALGEVLEAAARTDARVDEL